MKIKVTENGPYIVSGNIPLNKINFKVDEDKNPYEYGEKEVIPTDETYALCRCGNSKNKPFCDGTHEKVSFDGEEISSKNISDMKNHNLETENYKLIDHTILCDHSRFCLREGGIRKLIKENSEKSMEIAIEEAKNCPSGRLTLINKQTKQSSEPEYKKEILMIYDTGNETHGPIWVRGGIDIESSDGEKYETRNRMTLCQCGKSENKPFCDGSHWVSPESQSKFRKKWDLD